MTDSQRLLGEYVANGSEIAFRELVERYINLVYSTALRLVGGDTHLAQDVTQTVFIGLARRARTLSKAVMLGGWLHQYTYHSASKAIRAERRRQFREREAMAMNTLNEDCAANFPDLAPVLDEAITRLCAEDRQAILLRFFEQRDFHSIGAALGSREDAARMRVSRALEKLQVLLRRRGIGLSIAALGTALAGETVTAAPAGLAAAVAGTALASSTGGLGMTATLVKIMTLSKLKAGILAALLIGGTAASLVSQHQARLNFLEENQTLRQQLAQLQTENESLSNQVASARQVPPLNTERLRELIKLRGEVGMLRRQQREIEQASALSKAARGSSRSTSGALPELGRTAAPFQLQLVVDEPAEDTEPLTNSASGTEERLHVRKTPLLNQGAISSAAVSTNPSSGAPQIDLVFSDEGKEVFAQITRENLKKRLAIVLDGHLYSAPIIQSEITAGKAQVTGSFTPEEAQELASKINEAIK